MSLTIRRERRLPLREVIEGIAETSGFRPGGR